MLLPPLRLRVPWLITHCPVLKFAGTPGIALAGGDSVSDPVPAFTQEMPVLFCPGPPASVLVIVRSVVSPTV